MPTWHVVARHRVLRIALLGLAGRNPGNGLEPHRRVHASSGLRRWFAETNRHPFRRAVDTVFVYSNISEVN